MMPCSPRSPSLMEIVPSCEQWLDDMDQATRISG